VKHEAILFSDCGNSQIKELAQQCLLGDFSIGVLLKNRTVAVKEGFDLSGYRAGRWLEPVYVETDDGSHVIDRVELIEKCVPWGSELIDITRLKQWADKEGAVLQPGFYELWDWRKLAAVWSVDPGGSTPAHLTNGKATFSNTFPPWLKANNEKRRALFWANRNKTPKGWLSETVEYPQLPLVFLTRAQSETSQTTATNTEVDYVLNGFLDATDGKGGKPQLLRYMMETIGAEFVPGEKWRWTDPTGCIHSKSQKRLLNRLSELKNNASNRDNPTLVPP